MMIRRLAIVGSLTVAAVALTTSPALADDLADYLDEADRAVYSGKRLVATVWDGIERMGVIDVAQLGGMAMVGAGASHLMVGDGKVHDLESPCAAIAFAPRAETRVTHGYQLVSAETAVRLGRAVEVMEIREGDVLRMRLVVDVVTAAPLETEVFDNEGNRFRYSTMVEFSVSAPSMETYEDDGEYEMMVSVEEPQVPDSAGRYQLIDAYAGPEAAQQGFYTDGLFTFSLFAVEGKADIEELGEGGSAWTLDGFDYRRVVRPAEVWVLWNTLDSTYALVGDLPPDHLEEVLADLPRPEQRNWFSRMWERLFG